MTIKFERGVQNKREHKQAQNVKKIKGVIEDEKNYLKIWQKNPSFKDININNSIAKGLSLVFFAVSIIICAFTAGLELLEASILGIIFVIIYIIIFSDHFFALQFWVSFTFRKYASFDPFKKLIFWIEKSEPAILFRSNKQDLTHEAIQIFEVEVIPENVHSSIPTFLGALSSESILIPFTFQVVQKPYFSSLKSKSISQQKSHKSLLTNMYFCVTYDISGILYNHKIKKMKYEIKLMTNNFKSNLIAHFHHYKIKLLEEIHLINAMRTFYIKDTTSAAFKYENKKSLLGFITYFTVIKLTFFSIFIISFDIMLARYSLLLPYIVPIDVAIIVIILLVWWKDLFFGFTRNKLKNTKDIFLVKPFKNIKFFRTRQYPRTLFLNVEDKLLIGLKILNLKYVYSSTNCKLGPFLEALNNYKTNYSYTLANHPLSSYNFDHQGFKYLNNKTKNHLSYCKKDENKELKYMNWLAVRFGMWNSVLTLSISSYKIIDNFGEEDLQKLEGDLDIQKNALKGAFNLNLKNFRLTELSTRTLISGYMFSILKEKSFRKSGSHLNYVMLQGSSLEYLARVEDVLKKGITTKIPAEFNTPLHLENFITIGHTINTEVVGKEIPAGFTSDQLCNLLITNGHYLQREKTSMKIAVELIENSDPCIIFDFNGSWSKMLSYFKNTKFEDDLIFLKLGTTFTSDPLSSDIPYDNNNLRYLEYMFDAFGLAFKKDQRLLDLFRNTIRKNPEMDLPSIILDLQSQNDWERNPLNDSLIAFFSDFTPQELTALKKLEGNEEDIIRAFNFVSDNKTIILDLSLLRDTNKKLFFAFLIVSKIIHFITSTDEYVKKKIFIPNSDLFFESFYLDRNMDYTKINLFLDPLLQRGFGLILSANQIRYLHSNLLTYFNNIITFKAIDLNDINTIRTILNLQELTGKGIYSASRNNAYQITYLKTMSGNNVLIKRDDIEQSFPVIIDWEQIEESETVSFEEIIELMDKKGYNLRKTEKRILAQAKETIFEKDFGHYINYLDEIINFLKSLNSIDNIGNLYEQKVKKELLAYLHPKASKKTNKKDIIKKIRDEIYTLLVRHDYLIESHTRQASGSETLRTSFSVGDHYQEALDDYYASLENKPTDVKVQVLEKVFNNPPQKYIIQEGNLKEALMREFSDFNFEIFKIYSFINHSEFRKALKLEHGLLTRFLSRVYRHFNNDNSTMTTKNLETFVNELSSTKGFPFRFEELTNFMNKYKNFDYKDGSIIDGKDLAEEIYRFQYSFFVKIQSYIYGEK